MIFFMNGMPTSDSFFWFPAIFIGIWLFNSALFSLVSGWHSLARHFRATSRPGGRKVTGQVKQMGIVPENRVTHMIVSESGLYLYASLLFRFLHPPLLVPWREVRFAREIKTLWWYTYEIDIAQTTSLRVTRNAYE